MMNSVSYNSVVIKQYNLLLFAVPSSNCSNFYVPVDQAFIAVIFFSSDLEIRENVVKTLMILLIIFVFATVHLA